MTDNIYHCWTCGQAGHAKKDCPSKQRQAQAVGIPKRKPYVPAQGAAKKAGNQLPKQLKCSHCGRNNHAVENCFALHPEKRPTSEREKAMEAKIGALEERFKSLASSGQILDSPSTSGTKDSSSTPDYYMFGASGQVVSSAAVTRAQTVSRATPSTTGEPVHNLRARDNGPADQIGQARLPLSFGLADAAQSVSGRNSSLEASNPVTDVLHTLASKVLHTPLFTAMEWSSSDIQPAKVFHLAGRILEGKATPSSLTVANATTDLPTTEDPEEAAKRRARLAEEAIASFDAHTLDGQEPTSSYHSPAFASAAYLSDVAARPARERRGIRPGVVRMVNDSGILMVSRAGGNPIRVAPQSVMMDSGAQPVMIGKKLAHELRLTADDLAPCPFTIVTSIGHVERATGYTREPLQLSFRVKHGDSSAPLLLRCEVTDATNYDILVGQQTLYTLGFGLDNRTKEAWIRPGWSAGDGRKELIPVAFVAAATIESLSMVFGCSAMVDILPYGSALLEESLAFMGDVKHPQEMAPKRALMRHPKDPLPPWRDSSGLFQRCEGIVLSLGSTTPFVPDGPSMLACPILWRPT